MSNQFDPNDRRFRRSLGGRAVRRLRPAPRMLRPAGAAGAQLFKILGGAFLAVIVAIGAMLFSSVATVYGAYAQLADSLTPRIAQIEDIEDFQTTRLYDRNGELLYEFFGAGKRTRVPIEQISTTLISATIAIEDKTFFENPGVDFVGIARTLFTSLSAGEETGGASTITQQLIKTVILSEEERAYENRYQRKITEIILAQELSERYEKEEILELYLNEIYYGNLAYGIEAAADVYFDATASNLTLPQAALLAGLPQLPSVYDGVLRGVPLADGWLDPAYELPRGTPPPKWRQIAVLRQMVDEGYVTDQTARRAAEQDLPFASQAVPLNAPHFVFHVRKILEEQYGPTFAQQGLSIYTTIDLQLQRMVQQKAAERIAELEERNIHNAAVVVMQPNTGQILAMVGSIDYNRTVPTDTPGEEGNVLDGQVNVTTRERQPGSALKPFTYLAAMEQGATPETIFWDVPTEFPTGTGEWYAPLNYNGRWNGPVRMRTALANSLNMPAVKALKLAGINNTIDLLERLGIKTLTRGDNYYGLALTLGGGEVTPLELTTAYNTLASGGRYYSPAAILRIVDSSGEPVFTFQPRPMPPVVNPDYVAIISDMLSDDRAREPVWGLGSKLQLSRPAAVKTGTSNDWRDAWAVGYTPYVTVGVWTGNNNNEPTARVESLTGGGVIWHNVMEEMFADPRFARLLAEPYAGGELPLNFARPTWVAERPICPVPGPYGNYSRELFSPDMEDPTTLLTPAAIDAVGVENAPDGAPTDNCALFTEIPVVTVSETPITGTGILTDTTLIAAAYCVPPEDAFVPDERRTTLLAWKLPPPDPDERVVYNWEGLGATVDGRPSAVIQPDQIPPCTEEVIFSFGPPPSPNAVRMPDLQRYGENQAREILAGLGITSIWVDYQTRERIPDIYDEYVPYAVVSTLPAAGDWVEPEDTVILGVRAPDPDPEPEPAPDG
jgi:peptidoglycan glycosyltransferase